MARHPRGRLDVGAHARVVLDPGRASRATTTRRPPTAARPRSRRRRSPGRARPRGRPGRRRPPRAPSAPGRPRPTGGRGARATGSPLAVERRVAAAHLARLDGVHLVEVGVALARLADPDGDGERRLGHGQHARRCARALGGEHEPEQVGARLGGRGDVLLARQAADLHERAGEELGELRRRVGGAHQRRADEDRVRARELGRRALRPRLDAGLGDHDPVGGDRRRGARAAPRGRSRTWRGRAR